MRVMKKNFSNFIDGLAQIAFGLKIGSLKFKNLVGMSTWTWENYKIG